MSEQITQQETVKPVEEQRLELGQKIGDMLRERATRISAGENALRDVGTNYVDGMNQEMTTLESLRDGVEVTDDGNPEHFNLNRTATEYVDMIRNSVGPMVAQAQEEAAQFGGEAVEGWVGLVNQLYDELMQSGNLEEANDRGDRLVTTVRTRLYERRQGAENLKAEAAAAAERWGDTRDNANHSQGVMTSENGKLQEGWVRFLDTGLNKPYDSESVFGRRNALEESVNSQLYDGALSEPQDLFDLVDQYKATYQENEKK